MLYPCQIKFSLDQLQYGTGISYPYLFFLCGSGCRMNLTETKKKNEPIATGFKGTFHCIFYN